MARKASRPAKNPRRKVRRTPRERPVENYTHPEASALLRPDVGTQAQFKKRKPPQRYRYDSSLAPELAWDGQNGTREYGEFLLACIDDASRLEPPNRFPVPRRFSGGEGESLVEIHDLNEAVQALKALSHPFLNWAGKAEHLSFDVPTLPLFVHERLSTQAILETVKGHKTDKQLSMFDLWGERPRSISDQVLKAYEYPNGWVNRMILGDSLVVMNSLLHFEGLGGQVQMIYMDPPYGVKYGSNFQPFVRKRDVTHNDDDDLTREPEMVRAYRDTWELGLHSYLTYLRDRLVLCRHLLSPRGSIFVQINDENIHHVRELLDEIFGHENFVSQITFRTTTGFETSTIATLGDFLLWYARDIGRLRCHKVFEPQPLVLGEGNATWVLLPDGSHRGVTAAERRREVDVPQGARLYKPDNLLSQGRASEPQPFEFDGKTYFPGANSHWKPNYPGGLRRLADQGRIHVAENSLQYRRFPEDFPFAEHGNIWTDTSTGSFTEKKIYAVQTNTKVVERCVLLATEPGDLVLDPTCGGGTTAVVAEEWGRRWITIDVSRVPIALTRQRLLTRTYPFYELKDPARGPVGGFVYIRRQNRKGDEIGGIVPHIALESIANDEPPKEEVLVDRPERDDKVTRVTGPFAFEATIPAAIHEGGDESDAGADDEAHINFVERMLGVLRASPVLHIGGGKTVTLYSIRPPARTLALSAEALVDSTAPGQKPSLIEVVDESDAKSGTRLPLERKQVALLFGPENGAVNERMVYEAAREANAKGFTHLYVIGFAIQPTARSLVESCEAVTGIAATCIQATPDLMMGDLLKNMRSSQIFSVCGLPEVKLTATRSDDLVGTQYQVELLGLDVFDPATMEVMHRRGDDVPAWFLDTDYNGLCFHVCQAFFPRTAAWDDLKRSLRGVYDDSVWAHLAGAMSEPFAAGENRQIAVKVIDDRGNELLVIHGLAEAGRGNSSSGRPASRKIDRKAR